MKINNPSQFTDDRKELFYTWIHKMNDNELLDMFIKSSSAVCISSTIQPAFIFNCMAQACVKEINERFKNNNTKLYSYYQECVDYMELLKEGLDFMNKIKINNGNNQ